MTKISFTQIKVLESLVVSLKKFTLGLYLILSTKINPIKTKSVNVRYEEIRVLEETMGEDFQFGERRPVQRHKT